MSTPIHSTPALNDETRDEPFYTLLCDIGAAPDLTDEVEALKVICRCAYHLLTPAQREALMDCADVSNVEADVRQWVNAQHDEQDGLQS